MAQMVHGWKNTVTVRIKGPERMRFLNICAFHRIVFYRVEETEDGVDGTVSMADFKRLFELRHKAKITLSVKRRSGPYFWRRKNRKRRMAYVFALAAFAALYFFSLYVWDISFEGNVRYTDSYLLDVLKEEGYHPGIEVRQVSCSDLEKAIRNRFADITWVSARIDGTRLVVKVKENPEQSGESPEPVAGDLYASQSGVVARMITRCGTPQVAVGDEVEAGELLVSGRVPVYNDDGETDHWLYREASADVWIRYDSWFEFRVNRRQSRRVYRQTETRPALLVLGRRLALPFLSGDGWEELTVEQTPLCLFDNLYLPFGWERITGRRYTVETVSCGDEELKRQVNEQFFYFLEELEKIGVEIIENNVTIDMNEDFCLMKGPLVLEQNAVTLVPFEEPGEMTGSEDEL